MASDVATLQTQLASAHRQIAVLSAWSLLHRASKRLPVRDATGDTLDDLLDALGVDEESDLESCSQDQWEQMARRLKPVAATRFLRLLITPE